MTTQGQTGQVPSVEGIRPAHDQACAGDASEDDGTNSSNGEAMNRSAQSSPTSGLALLIEWANGQDHWIRKIVDNVIKTRSLLSDEHVTAIYELFLREKKLAQGDPERRTALVLSALSAYGDGHAARHARAHRECELVDTGSRDQISPTPNSLLWRKRERQDGLRADHEASGGCPYRTASFAEYPRRRARTDTAG